MAAGMDSQLCHGLKSGKAVQVRQSPPYYWSRLFLGPLH